MYNHDDDTLWTAAQRLSALAERIYGQAYRFGEEAIPKLGLNEDLIISAHGTANGANGQPQIGDQKGSLAVDGAGLCNIIEPLLPRNYNGRICISACQSNGQPSPEEFTFIEEFHTQINPAFHGVRVYGQSGDTTDDDMNPDSDTWQEVLSR